MTALPDVAILGAGPAGLGAAWRLRHLQRASVTVLEQHQQPGGNAASFEFGGQWVDFGSHRLHPACDPAILADIRRFLGDELLDRPRHGRIRLRGRWVRFPLRPLDLFARLDPGFALGSLGDALTKPLRSAASSDTFAGVLRASLGPTICDHFYFPYARKIWGRDPHQLSGIQARRRVAAGSVAKLIGKVLSQVPGFRRPGAGRFYYPKRGFGQISEVYAEQAQAAGARLLYGRRVTSLTPPAGPSDRWVVESEQAGARERLEVDHVWSTLPVTLLARMMGKHAPEEVHAASRGIAYRAMVLVYLELPVERFSEFDAHYFPGADVRITRLSEPKNYAARTEPGGRTVLCAELPSSLEDSWWSASDETLGELVAEDLATAGIPLPATPTAVLTRRLPQAYPIYTVGYEEPFGVLDRWVSGIPRLLSYGRQGLFAHDNTHHALAMAYAAADCLGPNGFDLARWADHRRVFETHVVVD
ncbi:MAG: NAD(P)/FAD-dependent oxidoreductase [Gemmatimonadales bacterium]